MGGGVFLYVHKSLLLQLRNCLNSVSVKASNWCSLYLWDSDSVLIGLVYRSPNSSVASNDKLLPKLLYLQDLPIHLSSYPLTFNGRFLISQTLIGVITL